VIIHVTDCFHPRLGGIEIQVGELAKAQQESGEKVQIVTATPAHRASSEDDYAYPVHRIVAPLPWELPVHPRASAHLARLFRELQPEAIHVHLGSVSPFAWSAIRQALRGGLPTVATVHSMWGPASRGMYRSMDQFTHWSRAPLVVTAVSAASANLIIKATPQRPVTVVSNGISPANWRRPPGHGHNRADHDVHITAVGRLAARKQPLVLLKALHTARERIDPQVRLRATVAGDGPALPLMRAYLRNHSMDWVRLAGRLDRDGVRDLLGSADLFVNPAVHESFGIATLEARTAGVPVIARTNNGISEFIRHGQEGLLCDSTDGLVDAIVRLVHDAGLRRRIRAHNEATEPAACTWPAVVSAFASCYERAASLAESGEPVA
jgi:glycosyltransferase involved in cell wall biosynthesis